MEEDVDKKLNLILEEAGNVPVDTTDVSLPSWFDSQKFQRGVKHFQDNYYAFFVSKMSGLILVLSIPSILEILVMTGKSSDPGKAFRRYMDTIWYMLQWYTEDPEQPHSKMNKALSIVRGKHCAASKKHGGFINQKDMVLTQFGFVGLGLTQMDFLGIKGSYQDLDGFIHFWKVIGHCMGISEKYNLCAGSVEEVRAVCDKLRLGYFQDRMNDLPKDFMKMTYAMLRGMKPVTPMMHPAAMLEFTRISLGMERNASLPFYPRIMLNLQIFVHTVLLTKRWLAAIFRPIFNGNMRLSIYLNYNWPYSAAFFLGKDAWKSDQDDN